MREIKFRAWADNEMIFFGFALISDESPRWYSKTIDDGVVMQYTGLKDKNGTEIYDGDIVVKNEYIWFDDGVPNYRGTVEWIYSQWQVVAHCVNPEKAGISDGINEGLNDEGVEEGGSSDWEVIGNIYQTPELINET